MPPRLRFDHFLLLSRICKDGAHGDQKKAHTSSAIRKVPTVWTARVVFDEPSWLMDERIMAQIYLADVIRKDNWFNQNDHL